KKLVPQMVVSSTNHSRDKLRTSFLDGGSMNFINFLSHKSRLHPSVFFLRTRVGSTLQGVHIQTPSNFVHPELMQVSGTHRVIFPRLI
uniref:Uncharacterized protein n=1 Tax=Aegilops tauschii subsp. strangulata TaxID=200361 RepID=A0A453IUD2_AEGTS